MRTNTGRPIDGIRGTVIPGPETAEVAALPQKASIQQPIANQASLSPVAALLQKEVTRRESLAYIGGFVLVMLGISRVVGHIDELSKAPSPKAGQNPAPASAKATGYGGGPYGV